MLSYFHRATKIPKGAFCSEVYKVQQKKNGKHEPKDICNLCLQGMNAYNIVAATHPNNKCVFTEDADAGRFRIPKKELLPSVVVSKTPGNELYYLDHRCEKLRPGRPLVEGYEVRLSWVCR